MPVAGVFSRAPEFIGDAGATYHGQLLIHQQQLAMIAIKVVQATAPAQRVVMPQLHPGLDQPAAQTRPQSQAAVGIKQASHPHLAPGGLLQRLDDGFGTVTGLNQIQFQINLLLCLLNSGQDSWEKLRAVDQQLELIVAAPAEHRAGHLNGP